MRDFHATSRSKLFGKCFIVLALLLIVFVQTGCKTTSTTPRAQDSSISTSGPDSWRYTENDVFHVALADFSPGQSNIEMLAHVPADGEILLLANHAFNVIGKTRSELEQEIHDYYVPQFYSNLTVVLYHGYSPSFFTLNGGIQSPGRQSIRCSVTLLTSIERAGGFTRDANPGKVRIQSSDGKVATIDCLKAQSDPRLDPLISPGDKITVPRSFWR